jgi:thiamine biosynthesis protein ThiI
MWDTVLVRYSEIGIKSRPVRLQLERALVRNMRKAMAGKVLDFRVHRTHGRIIVESDYADAVCGCLKHVFGIVSFSPARHISLAELDSFVMKNVESLVGEEPFAVRVTRKGEHGFTSKDMEEILGTIVVEKTGKSVDLSSPKSTLYVEIRDEDAYLYNSIISGPMGMPLNSQGKVYCFVGDGDGMLACWLAMKRGCRPVIFHTVPTDALDRWSPGIKIEKRRLESIEEVAEALKGEEFPIVLADNLKKTGIGKIREHQKMFYSVLRPLIGYDKGMMKELEKLVNS